MVLCVYDQDSLPRIIKAEKKKGSYRFSGTVEGPTYAELKMQRREACLPFFIEGSSISVSFNTTNPQASRVSGSRSNSLVRYQLEVCEESSNSNCLVDYVAENHASPIAPYIIHKYIAPTADHETLSALFALLDSNATHTWHYRQLAKMMERLNKLETGLAVPSFSFTDQQGRLIFSDSILTDSCRYAIVVGSSWCSQCSSVVNSIATNHKDIKTIAIDIDKQPNGWDSQVAKTLAVDHIPYIILLDTEGRIAARDIRVWQIPITNN